MNSRVTSFHFAGERYEISTQNVPVPGQNSVVHLMMEERLGALFTFGLESVSF